MWLGVAPICDFFEFRMLRESSRIELLNCMRLLTEESIHTWMTDNTWRGLDIEPGILHSLPPPSKNMAAADGRTQASLAGVIEGNQQPPTIELLATSHQSALLASARQLLEQKA
ncbi:uncharacterized protein BDCG_04545 [Blastomyces dermatitidis ER-3]|uniref:Uncharacterized protein n=1 Tax=Ajellomyces dermatitidis (strain ER-3 / ATCC MYA-2586) TaxID=559297 RepID=A0ABP2F2K4_AJEDR|nr:uncharacterized protein BDCG_04545 [Blastomyces dermatitidis ER-3]EEQ89425.1 hypothetical protein BDCG_04545 [Blastomyces dermatitidis ER-3]